MRRIISGTGILVSLLFACSCTDTVGVRGACYNQRVKPIIVSNCTNSGCHNPRDLEKGLDLTTYSGVMQIVKPGHPLQSDLYKVIRSNGEEKMPPDHDLSNADIQAIKGWISAGARENDCPTPVCDSIHFSYSAGVKPILKDNCLGCHTGGSVPLSGYSEVRSAALSGRLMGSLRHNPRYRAMPEGYKLDECSISTISKWVESGAPDN